MLMRSVRRSAREWMPLGWLIFLAYPVAGFVLQPHRPGEAALFWGVLLAFVVLYVASQWRQGGNDTAWALGGYAGSLVAFLLMVPVVGAAACSFLVYGSFMAGHQPSRAWALTLTGFSTLLLLGLMVWQRHLWVGYSWSWAVPAGWALTSGYMLFGAFGAHLGWQAREARRELRLAQVENERLAADAERERIARDLHDLLGHTLSVIVLKSELASRLTERDPARAAAEIREVERISREALSEVRAAVRGYRGSGLAAELARARVALDAAGVRLTVLGSFPALPPATEASAAMLLREAVTNVVRHARAGAVQVSLVSAPGGHTLTIQDDGIGGHAPEGTGLNSMRERLRAAGGTLERDGRQGTRLVAHFPAGDEVPALVPGREVL